MSTEETADPREQQVRDLLGRLGSAGSDAPEPVPADIAARLEETIAGLVAERESERISEERTATVAVRPLRPRWMPRLAAGAAAVIVLGFGGFAAADLGVFSGGSQGGGSADSSGAGGSAAEAPEESAPSASKPAPDLGTGADQRQRDTTQNNLAAAAPQLSSARFPADVRRLLAADPALRKPAPASQEPTGREPEGSLDSTDDTRGQSKSYPSPDPGTAARAACLAPEVAEGSRTTPVILDGAVATLVIGPLEDGVRRVEAYSCEGGRRLASATVTP